MALRSIMTLSPASILARRGATARRARFRGTAPSRRWLIPATTAPAFEDSWLEQRQDEGRQLGRIEARRGPRLGRHDEKVARSGQAAQQQGRQHQDQPAVALFPSRARTPDRLGPRPKVAPPLALVLVIPKKGSAGRSTGSARPMERAKKVKEAPPSGGSEARPTRDALVPAPLLRPFGRSRDSGSKRCRTAHLLAGAARRRHPARESREATAGPDPTRLVAPKPAAEDPEAPPLRQDGLGAASAFGLSLAAEPSGHRRAPDSP